MSLNAPPPPPPPTLSSSPSMRHHMSTPHLGQEDTPARAAMSTRRVSLLAFQSFAAPRREQRLTKSFTSACRREKTLPTGRDAAATTPIRSAAAGGMLPCNSAVATATAAAAAVASYEAESARTEDPAGPVPPPILLQTRRLFRRSSTCSSGSSVGSGPGMRSDGPLSRDGLAGQIHLGRPPRDVGSQSPSTTPTTASARVRFSSSALQPTSFRRFSAAYRSAPTLDVAEGRRASPSLAEVGLCGNKDGSSAALVPTPPLRTDVARSVVEDEAPSGCEAVLSELPRRSLSTSVLLGGNLDSEDCRVLRPRLKSVSEQ